MLQQIGLQTQARQAVRGAAQARLQQLAGSQPAVDAAVACQQRLPAKAGAEQGPRGQAAAAPAVQAAEEGTALLQEAAPGPHHQAPAKTGAEVVDCGGLLPNPKFAEAEPATLCAGAGTSPPGPDTSTVAWRVAAAAHVRGVERRMLEQLAHQMGL